MAELSIGLQLTRQIAAGEAAEARYEFIEPEHLFIGLCSLGKTLQAVELGQLIAPKEVIMALRPEWKVLVELLAKSHLNPTALRRELRKRMGPGNYQGNDKIIHRSPQSRQVFERAQQLAQKAPASMVDVTYLLAALLEVQGGLIAALLREEHADIEGLKGEALAITLPPFEGQPEGIALDPFRGEARQSFVQQYGKDLTQMAREEKLYAPIGRRAEMLQVVRTLARETKNNLVLVGDAGVGKTAIVEGLAWRIAQGKAPPAVQGKRIVQLDMSALIAGTKYRGDFEERLQGVLREASTSPEMILFIDEIHTLVGTGRAEGVAMDAANIMKPALSRGEICVIGATTREEYHRYIEKDPALERRFQPIFVNQPTPEEALEILHDIKARLERHHNVTIEREAMRAAVHLSVRYLPDRRLPDKAIDLLDEACAAVAVQWTSVITGEEPMDTTPGLVTADTVARVVAKWTGIPVAELRADERKRLQTMAEELKKRVIGQDEACEAVAQAVQRARLGLKAAGRPIGVLLFVGPTGVCKTELAKATAEFLFGSVKALVRLDMSEYQESHTVSRLIGAPPGYVGHEAEGQLTGALRRAPHCVVLLDEIEKAHGDVLNLFLQVFDEGRLTDSQGHTVDATNTLFILTSNLALEVKRPIGFYARGNGEVRKALIEHNLRPELVNRFDEVIVFRALNAGDLKCIAERLLGDLRTRLEARDITLVWDEVMLDYLSREGFSEQFGARELRRMIEQRVENEIAGMMLRSEIAAGQIVALNAESNELRILIAEDPEDTT